MKKDYLFINQHGSTPRLERGETVWVSNYEDFRMCTKAIFIGYNNEGKCECVLGEWQNNFIHGQEYKVNIYPFVRRNPPVPDAEIQKAIKLLTDAGRIIDGKVLK